MDDLQSQALSQEAEERLLHLANMPDEEIDLTEMPELTKEQLARSVRGLLPLGEQHVTLWLDEEVTAWLMQQNRNSYRDVNHILRREMQYQQKQNRKGQAASVNEAPPLSKAS